MRITGSKVAICIMIVSTIYGVGATQTQKGRWEPNKRWLQERRFYQRPDDGYVGDKRTAIAIATAIIVHVSHFDEGYVKKIGPLDAKLFGDVWVVYSFLPERDETGYPVAGGVTTVEISRTTGAILNFSSTQ